MLVTACGATANVIELPASKPSRFPENTASWLVTNARTASRLNSRLEFSSPSVTTTTCTISGRACSGNAASTRPKAVTDWPMASNNDGAPRGSSLM